jgi:uncharacterized membrane protein
LSNSKRIESIDLLRGIVIVVMAIDHVRGYFHGDSLKFSPTDLSQTNAAIFFTRWITHFCAPAFVFLAGTAAFMMSQRKTKAELSRFLLTRGLWLMFLEVTLINYGWFFNPTFSFIPLQVIWALGLCMVVLSVCINLPLKFIVVLGIAILFGHNLLDGIQPEGEGIGAIIWSELHVPKIFDLGFVKIRTNYPVLPWIGIMLLGYSTGHLYSANVDATQRRKRLLILGCSAIILFILLRALNIYGDRAPRVAQDTAMFSLMSFLNTTKYPPSLLYSLMTLGPALVFLALMERPLGKWAQPLLHIGRVPMFFYILHIFLIHIFCLLAMVFTGRDWHDAIITNGFKDFHPVGYGFSLAFTYLVWIVVILILYPFCKWYDGYKSSHKQIWWLSYL